ncbi:MAG: alpha/beta fold hydrolase [Rhizobiales bacterium]|nr:alpha/beta fold hydrolase [Hyphomicrobiales bacterium]
MSGTKATNFPGALGDTLAGRLDLPDGPARAYALFAHCFTCSKNVFAATRIASALNAHGIAVLRFDFTGLGSSDGEFANTNFSSNVADLVAAADFLRAHYRAPELLVGHSLGGAAVLAAAHEVPEARAVATIGAPSNAAHVAQNFGADLDRIKREGEAQVTLAGRSFTIKRQFLEDIENTTLEGHIASLKRALFVFHSPVDDTVGIDNASAIYQAARHPKSFISLDDADHLLSRREDAAYVADILAAAVKRYIAGDAEAETSSKRDESLAIVTETGQGKFQNRIEIGSHTLIADEPISVGGLGSGPGPYDLVKAGLGACTTMTLRMYADHKGLDVDKVSVSVGHDKVHADDCAECIERGLEGKVDTFTRHITIEGNLDEAARARMLEIADKCPVHRTLEAQAVIETTLAGE